MEEQMKIFMSNFMIMNKKNKIEYRKLQKGNRQSSINRKLEDRNRNKKRKLKENQKEQDRNKLFLEGQQRTIERQKEEQERIHRITEEQKIIEQARIGKILEDQDRKPQNFR